MKKYTAINKRTKIKLVTTNIQIFRQWQARPEIYEIEAEDGRIDIPIDTPVERGKKK